MTRRRRTGRGHEQPAPGQDPHLTTRGDTETQTDSRTQTDPYEAARGIVLRQLTAVPKTRAQLRDVLARRGVPEDVSGSVLDRFEDVGLVDDAEFARMWVESRHAGRSLSRRALRHELSGRGVDREIVEAAVEVVDGEAELAAATALVRRRLAVRAGEDPQRRDRRLLGLLARRGYGAEVAHRALRAALEES